MPANAANSQDLVEIADIKDNVVLLKGGGLCQLVMVGGTNFALKSEDEQNVIVKGYQNFLNSLDYQVQIVVHSRKINIERYLAFLDQRKNSEETGLLRNQISEYQEFVRGFVAQFAIMRKMFIVVVPYYPVGISGTGGITSSLPFFGKKKTEDDVKHDQEADFKENAGQLAQRVEAVLEGVRQIGLEATILSNQELMELYYNFYNPDTVERTDVAIPAQETK